MKIHKSLALAILMLSTANLAFNPKVEAEESPKYLENAINSNYPYTVTDAIKNLDRAKVSVEKLANSSRWLSIPQDLLMVYLWNKDTYHDETLLTLSNTWIDLSQKVDDKNFVEYAKLSNVLANLIKQNYQEAIKTSKTLKIDNYNKDSVFVAKLIKTLLGEEKQVQAAFQGNKAYSLTYTIRVLREQDTKDLVNYMPDSDVAHYLYSSALQKSAEDAQNPSDNREPDYKDAIEQLDLALRLEPTNQLYVLKKAFMTYDFKNIDASDQKLEQVFQDSYKDSYLAEAIANFYAKNSRFDKSIDYLTEALRQDKSRLSLYKKLNSLYAYTGQTEPVIALYEQAIKDYPNRTEFYNDLADLYQKNKQEYSKIIDLYNRGIQSNPNNSDLHLSLGDAYYYDKNFDKALEEYSNSISLDKNNTEAYGKLIALYWDRNDQNNVIKYANQSLKDNPDFSMGYLWLGSSYLKQNKTQDAINIIKKSITKSPDFVLGYNSLGIAYRADKKYDLAIQQFLKAVQMNPNYQEAMFNIGDTYAQKGDYVEAEKAYNLILKNDPYNDAVYFALGNLYTESKEFDKSIKSFEKAILLNPKALDYRNNLGNSYLKQNKLDDAVEEFESVLKLDPKYATAYYNLACIYSLKMDADYSLRFLEEAINLDNTLKDVAKNDTDFNNIKDDNRFKEIIN